MPNVPGRIEYWKQRFYKEFTCKPGQHMGIVGRTGAGKTNAMKWILRSELEYRNTVPMSKWSTIVWFDIGKASEILGICCGMAVPCRLILPEMMDVHIELFDPDNTFLEIEKVHVASEREIWSNLSKDRVNIVCFEGFIRDPERMASFIKKTFSTLINMALDYKLIDKVPMSIYYDEFHNICPSKGNSVSASVFSHGADIQLNIEKLRGHGIRFVAGLHRWTELRYGVRSSFMFIAAMSGANFTAHDQPKLCRYNRKFETLQPGQVMIAYPQRVLSDILLVPLYPIGSEYGYLYYRGMLRNPEPEVKKTKKQDNSEKPYGITSDILEELTV